MGKNVLVLKYLSLSYRKKVCPVFEIAENNWNPW